MRRHRPPARHEQVVEDDRALVGIPDGAISPKLRKRFGWIETTT